MVRRREAKHSPFYAALDFHTVELTVGLEVADAMTITCQVKDPDGNDVAERKSFLLYLSTDAQGDNLASSAPSGGVAAGDSGLLIPLVAGKVFQVVTDDTGAAEVVLTDTTDTAFYAIAVLPSGALVASAAADFATSTTTTTT